MSVHPAYCIDIYQGDTVVGDEDQGFDQVKALGIAFLDHKMTQGTYKVDKMAAFRLEKWLTDIPVKVTDVDGTVLLVKPRASLYHFNGTGTAKDEANWFIQHAKPLWKPGIDLELDWEDIGASGYQQSATWADAFCSYVEAAFGFPIKIYGGDAPREQNLRASGAILDRMLRRRFWFCQYGQFAPKLVPEPWLNHPDGVFEWQDDGDSLGPGRHTIPGITGYCDNSTVVGTMTVAKLNAKWGGGISNSAGAMV